LPDPDLGPHVYLLNRLDAHLALLHSLRRELGGARRAARRGSRLQAAAASALAAQHYAADIAQALAEIMDTHRPAVAGPQDRSSVRGMDLGLADRVYVLTGASRGLGLATAQCLIADGARVVLSAREQSTVDKAVAGLGPNAAGIAADLADPATPDALVEQAMRRFGRLDGALLSVGGPPAGGPMSMTDDQWRAAFESVFLGAVRAARTIAGSLGEGGAIALVLSSSARSPVPNLAISNGLRPASRW
jgi:3-oxoacyl-[acyl-carrier protein] reductase